MNSPLKTKNSCKARRKFLHSVISWPQQNENLEMEVSKRTNELVEYNQQLEQFAFIAAHNLRAPVARILGLGQLIQMLENHI